MWQHLCILHSNEPKALNLNAFEGGISDKAAGVLPWQTCVRSLLVSCGAHIFELSSKLGNNGANTQAGQEQNLTLIERFQGRSAYQFLLELICGLHSPILGETEIFGQFKTAAQNFLQQTPETPLKPVLNQLIVDAKRVRQAHLQELGTSSYGSWLRKNLPRGYPVHILGAGQLVREILPWLEKEFLQITIHCRRLEAIADLLSVRVQHCEWGRAVQSAGHVIVAAPVPSQELLPLLPMDLVVKMIDFRSESGEDPLPQASVVKLVDVFAALARTRERLQGQVASAQEMIQNLLQQHERQLTHRPFGWDDLCA